jgi:hypothetical protein
MKKLFNNTLTQHQKKEVAFYSNKLIKTVFENKIINKDHLLKLVVDYSKDLTCPESTLSQTLLKGCFPSITWTKQAILTQTCASPKISTIYTNEKSDVRFSTEIKIVDQLVN